MAAGGGGDGRVIPELLAFADGINGSGDPAEFELGNAALLGTFEGGATTVSAACWAWLASGTKINALAASINPAVHLDMKNGSDLFDKDYLRIGRR